MKKLDMKTKNIANDNYIKLKELFPNAITETIDDDGNIVRAIDKDILMQEINTFVVEGRQERYQFTWPDKNKTIIASNVPTTNTLRPCREESLNFDTTENLYIEGDNLEVLKVLKETYLGKIKCIYIDPPYNTGKDFVYSDKFSQSSDQYLINSNQIDDYRNRLITNTESNGRFHTDWLNMMYPRLNIAKNLLTDDGYIFISIDDNEQSNLKKICDEIFGESNYITNFVRTTRKGGGSMSRHVSTDHESLLLYAKNATKAERLYIPYDEDNLKRYSEKDSKGRYFWDTFERNRQGSSNSYSIELPDGTFRKGAWIYKENKYFELLKEGEIRFKKLSNSYSVQIKQRMNDTGKIMRSEIRDFPNSLATSELNELLGKEIFHYSKPSKLIKYILTSIDDDSIILDFFSGSSTTTHAVMQLNAEDGGNRKFIMVQLPEATDEKSEAYKAGYKYITEIGKERIRRAGKKILEENKDKEGIENLDIGFRVLKLDSSNMKDIYYTPQDTQQSMLEDLTDNIKEDRNELDLLFQVMLDLGVELSSTIEEIEISGKKIFSVADNYLLATFDKDIDDEIITEIAKKRPVFFVMRDASLTSDSVATNFEQIFNTYSPETTRSVL